MDLVVLTANGKIAAYKVTKLHEVVLIESPTQVHITTHKKRTVVFPGDFSYLCKVTKLMKAI